MEIKWCIFIAEAGAISWIKSEAIIIMKYFSIIMLVVLITTKLFGETFMAKIVGDNVRIRSSGNLNSDILDTVDSNVSVEVISRSLKTEKVSNAYDYWYKVKIADKEGWIYGKFIKFVINKSDVLNKIDYSLTIEEEKKYFSLVKKYLKGSFIYYGPDELYGFKINFVNDSEIVIYGINSDFPAGKYSENTVVGYRTFFNSIDGRIISFQYKGKKYTFDLLYDNYKDQFVIDGFLPEKEAVKYIKSRGNAE
jgi:hypothetical protein